MTFFSSTSRSSWQLRPSTVITILNKAPRLSNREVKGIAPPQITPKVVRLLTGFERMTIESIRAEQVAVTKKMLKALADLGLDPLKPYRFTKTGEVIEIGKYVPRY